MSARLLERERELRKIALALRSARSGAGALVRIEAGAGLGKSSLLRAAASTALRQGFLVLRACGSEHERALPFGGVLALFERCVRALAPAQRAELLSGPAALAAELFEAPSALLRAEAERTVALAHGLFWLVADLCEPPGDAGEGLVRRPLALLIDDAHLLDDGTLCFLSYLARRVQDLPVLALVALRPVDAGAQPQLQALRDQVATVLRPAPLSRQAVARALRYALHPEPVAPGLAGAALSASGGNPFLLGALIGELRRVGLAVGERSTVEVLGELAPPEVLAAVSSRLARLGADARALASAVAVLGDGVDLQLACSVAELAPASAASAFDALSAAELLVPAEPLGFIHPLLAQAIRARVPAGWRARAQLRAAKVLTGRGEAPERVAAHLLQAQRGGAAWVVEVLERAACRARERGVRGSPLRT